MEFSGPDPDVLRTLADEAKTIFRNAPSIVGVTDNWKNPTKRLTPDYSVYKAQKLGLSRSDLANSILVATDGMPIGGLYEGDVQLPIILKTTSNIAENMEGLRSIPVWGKRSKHSTPLDQVVDNIELRWEDELVHRYNGKRALKVQGGLRDGVTAAEAQSQIEDKINAVKLPEAYSLRWDGKLAVSKEANDALFQFLPLGLGLNAHHHRRHFLIF